MRLESISLTGFKSFVERTVVKVLPGITGIVGPNGCGKSNISEAVRWALGEQSPKSLRGQRMEDLIFHGSSSRKAVGLAEVELAFSNDGALTVPWSEVAVSRRLYRTGESEYLLNKNVCRLRDIVDLFAGTGASPRGYSVMDQDKLNHVLTAKPHERRVFIEEAAGIARYKQQRGETQGKLDGARGNLVRVRDVMDEVKRQLTSLERQARKAQQYKALQSEKRQLALALAAADHAALTAESGHLAAEMIRLRDAEQGLRARVTGFAAREAGEREALQESEHRLSDIRQSVQKIQGELERLLERREQIGVQIRELEAEAARLQAEVQTTRERITGIEAECGTAREGLAAAEHLVAGRREVAGGLEATLEEHRLRLGGERDRLEALRLEQVRLAGERTDLTREAGELRERHAQLTRRAARLGLELTQAEAEAGQLAGQRAALETGREAALASLSSLAASRARLEAVFTDLEERLAGAEARLADRRLALAARRSSLDALQELARAREGYGSGVRAVFREDGGSVVDGVVGTVADLLDVPPGLERAIEAVLGERLQWVVVERFEDARAAVAYLRAEGAGAATFLPLDHIPLPGELPSENGLRWAARAVHAPSLSLLHHLLGGVAIVDHFDHAEALWRQNGVVATYVTPAGDVLSPTGRISGGAEGPAGNEGHSLLGRKRQLRELADAVAHLEGEVAAEQSAVTELVAEVATVRARLAGLAESTQARLAERLANEKDLEQAGREHERVQRFRATVETESRQVAHETAETAEVLDRVEGRLTATREAEALHERAMSRTRETIDAAQERDSALGAELTACRVDLASATERVEALGREIARLDEIQVDLRDRLAQSRARHEQTGERTAWLSEERARADTSAQDVAAERHRVEDEARAASERHQALAAGLRGLENDRRAVEAELSRLVSSLHEVELRATECRVRGEELTQEVWRVHGVDADALAAAHDPECDVTAARERVAELEGKLEAIGPVNLVADDEYRELDERLTFLHTQHDDLVNSIKDLEKALRGMTRTAQERFAQAFQEINVQFVQIFERLFEGGRAELRLVEAEDGGDPLDTGVDLMAQPRGKRLQSVTLMSGGERALTGLALLFAIFYYRPSPFCVLDEVDAPLDDANIHRFLRVLRELTSQTQFLVITHNRKTMEAADVLYGITMQEPGLSKLVSVNLNGV
jgi:chromosome segregation protein